jgi:prepilin-type N-terminal cleavage/methylation domain-containing protein
MNRRAHAHARAEGFTLIELLVTLMLMTITVTLVAPGLFNTLAGIEQKSVIKEVAQDIAWLRNQAFLREYPLEIGLDKSAITAFRLQADGAPSPGPYFEKSYPLVAFPEQSFNVSANGVADVAQVQLSIDGQQRVIKVDTW